MKFTAPLLGAILLHTASAHFTFQYIWTPNDNGYNVGIRVPPSNNPVTDVTSTDMTCNVNGLTGSGVSTITVAAGTNVTMEWHQHTQRTGEDPISGGHKGPVIVYLAKVPSGQTAATFNGQGTVWTKVWQSGLLNASTQQWATDVVNSNAGKHSFIIPSSIPSGEYLLRTEVIALHVAQSYPGAQFYIGCAQLNITNGGSASPPKIAIPGYYQSTDPGITVNIYNNLQSYTIPGGAVWSG